MLKLVYQLKPKYLHNMIQLLYNKKTLKTAIIMLDNKTFVFNYSKFFIRNNLNSKDLILDNSLEISAGLSKVEYNIPGYSIIVNKFLYNHKLDKNLKFYWFNPTINLSQNLMQHITNIKVKNFIFFTKVTKGGVECYASGFKGFLPKEHLTLVVKHLKNYCLKSKLNYFIILNSKSKFFCLKIPVNLSKLTVISSNIRNGYYKKYKNTHTINNKFNIIFNYPKQLLTYEKQHQLETAE